MNWCVAETTFFFFYFKWLTYGIIFYLKLMHPILDAFTGTALEWMKKLLFTFNEGNIGKFEALAPLFPQEVWITRCVVLYRVPIADLIFIYIADFTRKLCVFEAKDMSDGVDRECVQEASQRPDDEFPDYWRRDTAACRGGGTPCDEGAQVGFLDRDFMLPRVDEVWLF